MVLDEANRLIEFNQASQNMFPKLNKTMFGVDFNQVWVELSGDPFPSNLENSSFTREIQIGSTQSKRIYQVHTSSLEQAKNKGLLIIFTDITELKSLQMELEHQAFYDELTRIYNRRAFFQKCEQSFSESKIASAPLTIILIDIDYFKRVNDTYGHSVGDQLLRHVVKVCQTQLKEDMLFARYGGEEFVLALDGRTEIEGEALANQLRKSVEAQPLITTEEAISVTLSIGVAQATNESEETLYQLLNRADQALYSAKSNGRNRVRVYAKI